MSDEICPICLHYKDHIAHTYRYWQIIELRRERDELQRKLNIAVEALKWCISLDKENTVTEMARTALKKLEE